MKKPLCLLISVTLCVTLAACNRNPMSKIENPGERSPSPALPTVLAEATPTPEESAPPADRSDDRYHAYAAALASLMQNHVLPDGTDAGEQLGDMSENQFAVYDVDNDGKDELIILYSTTITAGMAGYILAYDDASGALQTQLREFPAFVFYDNGVVKALWSHNQGHAGDSFWPYSLYRYDSDADRYELIGMVDAWDKNYADRDYQGNLFPIDIDQSGTGFVYYIMNDASYDDSHPVDASEYDAWVGAYLKDASEVQIPYRDLTEETISNIRNR